MQPIHPRTKLITSTLLLSMALCALPGAASAEDVDQGYARLVRVVSSFEAPQRLSDDTTYVTLKNLGEVKRVLDAVTEVLAQLRSDPASPKLKRTDSSNLERVLQGLQKDLAAITGMGVEPGALVRAQIILDAREHSSVTFGDTAYPALLSSAAVALYVDDELVLERADDTPQLRSLARACPMARYEARPDLGAASPVDWRRYLADVKQFVSTEKALSGASDLPASLTVLADPEDRAPEPERRGPRAKPFPVPITVVPVETWAAGFAPGTTEVISGGGKRELTLGDYLQKQYATTYASSLHANCAWVAQRLVLDRLPKELERAALPSAKQEKAQAKAERSAPSRRPSAAAREESRRADREAAEKEAWKARCRRVYKLEIDRMRSCAMSMGCSLQDRMCAANCMAERSSAFRECYVLSSTWREE